MQGVDHLQIHMTAIKKLEEANDALLVVEEHVIRFHNDRSSQSQRVQGAVKALRDAVPWLSEPLPGE